MRNFLFHRVNPERDPLWDPMDPALFEKCIQHISKKYDVRLFEDINFDELKGNDHKNIATIMFDDGYKDNIEFAAPILAKYNIKASFYVVTNCIEKNIPTWTHILENSFQKTKISSIELPFDFLKKEFKKAEFNNDQERLDYCAKLKPFLKLQKAKDRQQVLDCLEETLTDVTPQKLMMNWDDLRALHQQGHYIGSHTVSHNMLGTMEDVVEIKEELALSMEIIKREMGYSPKTISYPIGSYNEQVKDLSKKVGYTIGLAVNQDIHDPNIRDMFEVNRIELYNESWLKTKLRISNALETTKKLIRYR